MCRKNVPEPYPGPPILIPWCLEGSPGHPPAWARATRRPARTTAQAETPERPPDGGSFQAERRPGGPFPRTRVPVPGQRCIGSPAGRGQVSGVGPHSMSDETPGSGPAGQPTSNWPVVVLACLPVLESGTGLSRPARTATRSRRSRKSVSGRSAATWGEEEHIASRLFALSFEVALQDLAKLRQERDRSLRPPGLEPLALVPRVRLKRDGVHVEPDFSDSEPGYFLLATPCEQESGDQRVGQPHSGSCGLAG
jgi:hypothetical protein